MSPITLRVSSSSLQKNKVQPPYLPAFTSSPDRYDHIAQNPWRGASGPKLKDTERRTALTVGGHEVLDDLICVWIVPDDGSCDGWNELHIELNGI